MKSTTCGEMEPQKLAYGEMDEKTILLRLENYNAYGQFDCG